MAVDPKKRQQKLAKKAAKRKKAQAAARSTGEASKFPSKLKQIIKLAPPIHECLVPSTVFDQGMGNVAVSRRLPNGHVIFSIFLVDAYCLGIKDVTYDAVSESEYDGMIERIYDNVPVRPIHPACARKLVEGAVDYARELGFSPHSDYKKARIIFGDIDPTECTQEFTYGSEGKPFFISGPRDTPTKCDRIMRTLTERFGPDGFRFMMGSGGEEVPREQFFFPTEE